jgi:hypothetical protein|nr:MAG TPA: hypothetical protein [Caudoviricetes sp.]
MYGMAAGCHSPVVVSGSDGNAFAGKSIETVIPKKYFFQTPCRNMGCFVV